MKYTGYVGIGFSALHSINEVNEACSTGRESECTKKRFTETGSFAGGTFGGLAGGAIGAGVCTIVLGTATLAAGGSGALVCAVVLGSTGGYIAGEKGSSFGEWVGEKIYEVIGE